MCPSNTRTVLVVDDSPDTLEMIKRYLAGWGYSVLTSNSVDDALAVLAEAEIDFVITDMKMPKYSGLDLLKHLRENHPTIETMMVTGFGTIENAIQAVKSGASEYLCKPFTEEELRTAVDSLEEKSRMRSTISHENECAPVGLIGESPAMKKLYSIIAKAATTTATVLITGESGTGKELVARAIHYTSSRASSPFVPVNCGGIPEGLLESELFGYVKGAFTGATETRSGFFLTAEGGTIFLDEIGETSLMMQVKLLRVLQDKSVYMVGSAKGRTVDARIIAATNKDLRVLVDKGVFREDLFFRLNIIVIDLPPLRDRDDDILRLALHFKGKYSKDYGRDEPEFAENVLNALRNYSWPGNVRELENLVQRMVVMNDKNVIDSDLLPEHMRYSLPQHYNVSRSLEDVELEHITRVLQSVNGNKSVASEILHIDRKTLREKIRKYGLPY